MKWSKTCVTFILLVALLNAVHFGRRKIWQFDNLSDSFLMEKSENVEKAMMQCII